MAKQKKSKPDPSDPSLKDAIKTTRFWEYYFRRLVTEAESGQHPESARELVGEFVMALDNQELPRSQVLGFLHRALGEIYSGKDPRIALHLTPPAHRPKGQQNRKQLKLAVEYQVRIRAGMRKAPAKDEVGHKHGASAKAVERAVKEFNLLPGLSDEELDALRQSWAGTSKKGR